jgi:hypothetical protein
MKAVPIGKGMFRIIVRSKAKRDRLSLISEVHMDGNRAIFPEWLYNSIKKIVNPPVKKRKKQPEQTSLF